jgi:hypothetical protein
MPIRVLAVVFGFCLPMLSVATAEIRFEVRLASEDVPPGKGPGKGPEKRPAKANGRVLLSVADAKSRPGFTSVDLPYRTVLGVDVADFTSETVVRLDAKPIAFPPGKSIADLPAGEYNVQAVFCTNRDLNLWNAPGNRYCKPKKVTLDPKSDMPIPIVLDQVFTEEMPKESATHRYHKLESKLLSDFHGRPMFNRVGVVLPANYAMDPEKKYGLVVHIGGFGTRFTGSSRMKPDPRFVQILLDGAGPLGDPYYVNSANHGPYGDSLVREILPAIEKEYRCLGSPQSRFTTGGSTGGWVSLALQIFYPETFNGCWSECPDGVDFRAFELIDIFKDTNAYVNRFGFERPAKRNVAGDTIYTMRHEVQLERVLGAADRWELSGQQWASWNATYGPKGADGLPVPLWDGATGKINREVVQHWEKYDLRKIVETNWKTLGPKLAGKVHIWVGDADDYFLNNGVHLLKQFLVKQTDPKFDGVIEIEPRKPHTSGWAKKKIFDEMEERLTGMSGKGQR